MKLSKEQQSIVNSLNKNFNLLLGSMGSGKGGMGLTWASKKGQDVLYITSANLIPSIHEENKKWGTPVDNLKTTSYHQLTHDKKSDKSVMLAADRILDQAGNIDCIVFDEAQNIKNPKSKFSKVAQALMAKAKVPVLVMTGTFRSVKNSDLFTFMAMYDVLNTLKDFTYIDIKRTIKEYEEQYQLKSMVKMGARVIPQIKDVKADVLRDKFFQRTFKIKNTNMDSIDVEVHYHEVECLNSVENLFKKLKKQKKVRVKNSKLTNYTTHTLSQFCDGHIQLTDMITEDKSVEFFKVQPKLDKLNDILPNIEGKVIIFTRYVSSVELIASKLGSTAVTLGNSGVQETLHKFKNCEHVKYLVTTIPKGSTGHDLDIAKGVVFYAVSHNYMQLEQAFYRHVRYNTTANKEIHFIYANLEKKKFKDIIKKVKENANKYGFGSILTK